MGARGYQYPHPNVLMCIEQLEQFLHAVGQTLPELTARGLNEEAARSNPQWAKAYDEIRTCKEDILTMLELLARACQERGLDPTPLDRFGQRWVALHGKYPDLWDALTKFSDSFPGDFLADNLTPTVFRLQKTVILERDGEELAADEEERWDRATGVVENPSDESAYRSATWIVREYPKHVSDPKALHKVLRMHTQIRRWKPSPQRLSIHLGDWLDFIKNRYRSNGNASADPSHDEIERRKKEIRERKRRQ